MFYASVMLLPRVGGSSTGARVQTPQLEWQGGRKLSILKPIEKTISKNGERISGSRSRMIEDCSGTIWGSYSVQQLIGVGDFAHNNHTDTRKNGLLHKRCLQEARCAQ